ADVLHCLLEKWCTRHLTKLAAQAVDDAIGAGLALAERLQRHEHIAEIGLAAAREAGDRRNRGVFPDDRHHLCQLRAHELKRNALVALQPADQATRILLREEALGHDDEE